MIAAISFSSVCNRAYKLWIRASLEDVAEVVCAKEKAGINKRPKNKAPSFPHERVVKRYPRKPSEYFGFGIERASAIDFTVSISVFISELIIPLTFDANTRSA